MNNFPKNANISFFFPNFAKCIYHNSTNGQKRIETNNS